MVSSSLSCGGGSEYLINNELTAGSDCSANYCPKAKREAIIIYIDLNIIPNPFVSLLTVHCTAAILVLSCLCEGRGREMTFKE